MTTINHINCGTLHAPPSPRASCHCLLLADRKGLALIDTGIGLLDVQRPLVRIGADLIQLAGFQFDEADTAARRVEALGFRVEDVTDLILTHGDPDHAGGLADFPLARVHLAEEELASISNKHPRYRQPHFDHAPRWAPHRPGDRVWFGLEARTVPLGFESEVLLIPLFGHSFGHCGVAIQKDDGWLLHVGDAYYLRAELASDDNPVSLLAARNADDDAQRRASLDHLRGLARDQPHEIQLCGYHDFSEFPPEADS